MKFGRRFTKQQPVNGLSNGNNSLIPNKMQASNNHNPQFKSNVRYSTLI